MREAAGSAGAAQPRTTPEPVNPAAGADTDQQARREIAGLKAGVQRRARHLVQWLAVPAGVLAGWLMACRPRG